MLKQLNKQPNCHRSIFFFAKYNKSIDVLTRLIDRRALLFQTPT